jgi:hypothetical protein
VTHPEPQNLASPFHTSKFSDYALSYFLPPLVQNTLPVPPQTTPANPLFQNAAPSMPDLRCPSRRVSHQSYAGGSRQTLLGRIWCLGSARRRENGRMVQAW